MDIAGCLTEWYNLIQAIEPKSKTELVKFRLLRRSYFDTHRLQDRVKQLAKLYGTGETLYDKRPDRPRCRHVFVAALNTDSRGSPLGYNLFRTYDAPVSTGTLKGPKSPESYELSSAYAITGAAEYFANPWREFIAENGKLRFHDTKFPSPHNITILALNEMWSLYGLDVHISVIVNIGPGTPNTSDIQQIARRFSWPRSRAQSLKTNKSINEFQMTESQKVGHSRDRTSTPAKGKQSSGVVRRDTYGDPLEGRMDNMLKQEEYKIEDEIRVKLRKVYPIDTPSYYRLAPENSPKGTAQNDTSAPDLALDATIKFVDSKDFQGTLTEVSRSFSENINAPA